MNRKLGCLIATHIILAFTARPAIATSAPMIVNRPALANIHNLVLDISIIPFATYPSPAADEIETKIGAAVAARLSNDGFAILEAYDAPVQTPELTIEVRSTVDDRFPGIVVMTARLILRDMVTIKNDRIRKYEDSVILWVWSDTSGDTFVVTREEVPDTIADWVNDAITAFEKAVRDASVLPRKVTGQR